MTRLYQLLNAGELDSYWEGRHRKITVESIHRRQQRLITEAQQGAEVKARKKGAKSSAPADNISSPQARG
jgi:hypothetical protein